MNNLKKQSNRLIWIDCIKLFSCVLVTLGHLYMSMMVIGFISSESIYYCWPIQTVYSFHVPLFFVCSGYLYQLKKSDYSFNEHIEVIKSKTLNLGVPYFIFSIITLSLKVIFSSEVNNKATPLFETLFLNPVAPYWYLYAVFFIFCFIPRMKNRATICGALCIAFIIKIIYILLPINVDFIPYAIRTVIINAVWFILGMIFTTIDTKNNKFYEILGKSSLYIAIGLSIIFYRHEETSNLVQFIIGGLFVISIVYLFASKSNYLYEKEIKKCSEYFMPIFLMHTICAAAVRTCILKLGITSLLVHILMGLIASFIIPIIIYEIAKKNWILLFWIEPEKALKQKKSQAEGDKECLTIND